MNTSQKLEAYKNYKNLNLFQLATYLEMGVADLWTKKPHLLVR